MHSLELTSIESLVRRYAPELIPEADASIRQLTQLGAFMLVAVIAVVTLAGFGVQESRWALAATIGTGVLGATGTGWAMRRRHEHNVRRFSKQLADSPLIFYDAVATKFSDEIARQRARTVGPNSEWGRARLSLEAAAQESDRSFAYWKERLATDRDNEIAASQLATATRLREKFQTALAELDQRARLLMTFFNDCEARVAIMHSTKRDLEEIRKLDRLADQSDEIVTHATDTLVRIGSSFVTEALRVGNALGGLERAGLVNLAGAVSVDHLETLADRIVESSKRDQNALESVTGSMHQFE